MSLSTQRALAPVEQIQRLGGVYPERRPILARAGGEYLSPVLTQPTLISGENLWRGFSMEVLDTPAGETPPRIELVRHMICTIDSTEPFNFSWRENGRELSKLVSAGDNLIRSQQELTALRWDGPARALILGIEPETMEQIVRDFLPSRPIQLQEFYGAPDDYILSLMRALAADLEHGSPTGSILGESLCTAIAMHAARRYAVWTADARSMNGPAPDTRLHIVRDYIDSRLSHDLSLFELAEVAGVSPFYLTRLFKERMGMSVYQYVLDQRMARAKRLLQRTDLDLSLIAAALGFRYQSHFSQAFRRRTGLTPLQFRQST